VKVIKPTSHVKWGPEPCSRALKSDKNARPIWVSIWVNLTYHCRVMAAHMTIPADFVKQLQALEGLNSPDLLRAIEQQNPPTAVRINPRKNHALALAEKVPNTKNSFYLPERPSFTADPAFHAGAYYVQESSSMQLEYALHLLYPSHKPAICLDLCAAPGGKSVVISEFLGSDGILISNEIHKLRSDILVENLQKWGTTQTLITRNEIDHFSGLEDFFDLILIDAPCSGEGMFRKHPEAMDQWSLSRVDQCAMRQSILLEKAYHLLKPGGHLIYSTCTFNLAENELQIKRLLEMVEGESVSLPLPNGACRSEVAGIHAWRFYPHIYQGEGLFLSVVKKGGERSPHQPRKIKSKEPSLTREMQRERQALMGSLSSPQTLLNYRGDWFEGSQALVDVYHRISNQLYILSLGLPLGHFKGTDFIPSAALATSNRSNSWSENRLEVDQSTALALLSKGTPQINTHLKGWTLITHQNNGLLWCKGSGTRYNNYYPKEWRIRTEWTRLLDELG
ncbi:MAG TPA: hypothetical protein VFV37_08390, partial [Luteibaculaceae bacterium]|nr:hypothetical protein [Luteibaculaceae bacterium]